MTPSTPPIIRSHRSAWLSMSEVISQGEPDRYRGQCGLELGVHHHRFLPKLLSRGEFIPQQTLNMTGKSLRVVNSGSPRGLPLSEKFMTPIRILHYCSRVRKKRLYSRLRSYRKVSVSTHNRSYSRLTPYLGCQYRRHGAHHHRSQLWFKTYHTINLRWAATDCQTTTLCVIADADAAPNSTRIPADQATCGIVDHRAPTNH